MFKQRLIHIVICSLLTFSYSVVGGEVFYETSENGETRVVFQQSAPAAVDLRSDETALTRALSRLTQFGTIKKVLLDGVTTSVSDNVIRLHNLRVLSDETDLNDYITIDLLLDVASLQLVPISNEVVPNLGIYVRDEQLFSKDVPDDIVLTSPGGTALVPNQEHTITATAADKFTMRLQAGTVLALRINSPSDDFELNITRPNGNYFVQRFYQQGSSWVSYGSSILQSGVYKFRFIPQNDAALTLSFGFTNQNRRPLVDLDSGDSISLSLSGWGHQYAKYRLQLQAGDLLQLSDPSDSDIQLVLVNSNSRVLQNSFGGPIFHKVAQPGTYYLFVVNRDAYNASSYFGTVTITSDPDSAQYPRLRSISKQTAQLGNNYALRLRASSEPTEFEANGLPTGLSLNKTTGRISGIPQIAGTFSINVSAKNEFGSDRRDFLLEVVFAP